MTEILNHIEEHPQETQRLIGLDYSELQQLIQNAERLHYKKQDLLESEKIRIIEKGGGRKPKLSIQEQIILTLVYLRHNLIDTPIKKPRNSELTIEQKEENTLFASKRIFVEHRIRSIKIFRVAQERFRLNPKKYEQVILATCGLVRLIIGTLILPTEIQPAASG
ncbi:MAG: transposase family protein [Rivularia sp. (in: cyanobacteria)]